MLAKGNPTIQQLKIIAPSDGGVAWLRAGFKCRGVSLNLATSTAKVEIRLCGAIAEPFAKNGGIGQQL